MCVFSQCETIVEQHEDELIEFFAHETDNVKDKLCSKRTGNAVNIFDSVFFNFKPICELHMICVFYFTVVTSYMHLPVKKIDNTFSSLANTCTILKKYSERHMELYHQYFFLLHLHM